MSLEEAIEQLINLGEKDPIEITRKLRDQYGAEWMRAELLQRDDELIAGFARNMLGARRRSTEGPRLDLARARHGEFMLASKWVPEIGWKKLADLTADDCRAVAAHYRMLARAAGIRADLFDGFAELIEAEGVATLGDVSVALPQLAEVAA